MMDARWLRPLGVGEVIDAALKIYRARFGTMLKAVAVVVIPVQLINVIVVLSLPDVTTTRTTSNGFTTTTSSGNGGAVLAALLVVQVVTILSGLVATAACLKVVSDAYLGTVTTWRESLKFGLSKFHSLVWIGFLSTAGVLLGAIFCLVPGIWLYVAWAVAVPALLIEGVKGTKALSRSFTLIRHRWWATCGALLIAALITGAVTFALTIFTIPLLLGGASFTTSQVANAIATGIAAVLTTPFTAAVTALIYFELRVRKEGFDLALLAQRIGVAPPPGGIGVPPPPGGFAPTPWAGAPAQPWGPPANQPWGAPPPAGAWDPMPGAWSPPPPQSWAPPPHQPPAPGWAPPPQTEWSPPPPDPGTPPPPQPGAWSPPPIEPWDPIQPVPAPPSAPWANPAAPPSSPPAAVPVEEPPPPPAEQSSSPWAAIPVDPDPPSDPPPPPPPEPPREA